MKQVIIKSIRLSNWKGQDRFLSFSDGLNVITGRNGSGKTSIYKAFCWLLTGYTDAVNVKNHELFDNREEITHRTPSAIVSAVISVDGREYTIERSAIPGFSRKRSTSEWVKSPSDTYTTKIDDVETKAYDFNAFITDTFGSLEMLPYMLMGERFANIMMDDKNKARKVLESIVGKISVEDMKGDYSSICKDIEQYGVDVLQDRYKNQLRPLKKALEDNEAIIAIKRKDLSAYNEMDFEQINSDIHYHMGRIAAIDKELAGASEKMEGKIKERNDALLKVSEAEERLSDYVRKYNKENSEGIARLERVYSSIREDNEAIIRDNRMAEQEFKLNESRIEEAQAEYYALTKKRKELVEKRNEIKSLVFDGDNCKYCGQPLPFDKVNELKKKFNERKDEALDDVIAEGMAVRKRMDEMELRLTELNAIKEKGYEVKPLIDEQKAKDDIEDAKRSVIPVENTEKYIELMAGINALKEKVPVLSGQIDTEKLNKEKEGLMASMKELCAKMGKKEVAKETEESIQSYIKSNAQLYNEIAELEGKIDSVKQFVEERASLVSERINRRMSSSVIIMYSRQKDGEFKPDCVLQGKDGIRYATMNTASRIKSCLELQMMFCDHFDINLPVFVDEASIFSSDNLPKFESQTILMYASDDNELVMR